MCIVYMLAVMIFIQLWISMDQQWIAQDNYCNIESIRTILVLSKLVGNDACRK